jgi:predicted RNA-binding Zn ribbon-like protein
MVFVRIDRYAIRVALDRQDAELVAFLNGDGPHLLRRLAATVANGDMLSRRQLETLNTILARTPVEARLVDGGEGRYALDMHPVADDPERELAGSFASLLRRAPDRLRRCDECATFFLDATRSRTQRWCGERCGDRARVRAHRARRAR